MKLLILTPNIPYPLSEGGKISQYSIIDYLRKECSIVLGLAIYNKEHENYADHLQTLWPDVSIKKMLFYSTIEKQDINTKIKNKLRKSLQSINKLKKKNSDILYDTEIPYYIQVFEIKFPAFIQQVSNLINEVQPDIVQIDILDYVDLVTLIPANIKKVFVHHELRFVRLQSFFDGTQHPMRAYDHYIIKKVKHQELAFLKLYDGVFVFSDDDKKKLADEGLDATVYNSPFPVLDAYFQPPEKELQIDKLVFIGGENHHPNIDAVEWYVQQVASKIYNVKRIVLHIIGKWSDNAISKYKNSTAIHFAGYVEDIIAYCKNSIMIVPIRMGSGIRSKILYAMAQGVPVISTTIGCEGIPVKDRESIMMADSPLAFEEALRALINDSNQTLKIVKCAQAIMKQYFSQENAAALRRKYLKEILAK